LKTALRQIQEDAKQISDAASNQQKAKAWIALNRDAVKFSAKMNRSFPHSRIIQGDRTEPQAAESLAEQATAFGVRIYFCEPDGAWAASNEGYFKYLELWPTGPDADEAAWMGPAGNQSGCGDFEGSPEELQDLVTKNRSFLSQFPHSRFAVEAKKRLAYAEEALSSSSKSQQK
jgi:uncharacterized protein YecE (DUF72 family)